MIIFHRLIELLFIVKPSHQSRSLLVFHSSLSSFNDNYQSNENLTLRIKNTINKFLLLSSQEIYKIEFKLHIMIF